MIDGLLLFPLLPPSLLCVFRPSLVWWYLHGGVGDEVGGLGVEGLAELHHVETQRTQCLTNGGAGLGSTRRHTKPHLTNTMGTQTR